MKFEQLRKIEERFEKAGDYLDNTIAALQKDIELNPTMPVEEMKFNLSGVLMNVTNIATLLDITSEAVYRLAMAEKEGEFLAHFGTDVETPIPNDVDRFTNGRMDIDPLEKAFGPKIDVKAELKKQTLTGPNRSDSIDSETTEGGEPT